MTAIAIVTGAGSGIGKATAKRFAVGGFEVVLCDLNQSRLDGAAEELRAQGTKVRPVLADVSTAGGVEAARVAIGDDGHNVDVLVNNAGVTRAGNVLDLREDEWDLVQRVNLKSVFLMCKMAIPLMKERGHGSVVNIASGAGLNGVRYRVAYGSSKAGVVNLTRCLALDHARDGIRANVICPGVIDTEAMQKSFGPGGVPESARDAHPLGRIGTPEEVAEVAWFLTTPSASFVTGAVIPVDGGSSAGHYGMPVGQRR